jgi:hypothetical protein
MGNRQFIHGNEYLCTNKKWFKSIDRFPTGGVQKRASLNSLSMDQS